MPRKPSPPPKKGRTTINLPAETLAEARRVAHNRKVSLNSMICEILSEGLRRQRAAERSEAVLENYKKAFSGFSDDELSILDGVILEPLEPEA